MGNSFAKVKLNHHHMVGRGVKVWLEQNRLSDPEPRAVAKGYRILPYNGAWAVIDGTGDFVRLFKGPHAAAKASACARSFERVARDK